MAWTYQNDVTFSGTAPETNSYGVPGGAGGTATQFYFTGAGVRYRRYTLSGNVLTFDTTWNTTEGSIDTLDGVLEVVGVDATRLWGFREDRVLWFPLVLTSTSATRDLALRIRLSRTAYMVTGAFDAAVSDTAFFMVGTISGMTGTRLMRFDSKTAATTVADNVLLTSSTGADIPSGGRRRVYTNGTHVWVVTFNSAGTNAKGYAFAHATLDRVLAQDFDLTFTANHNDATFDGTDFYFIRDDRSSLRKYSFVANVVPSGTVPRQTAVPTVEFSLDLTDFITGSPTPTFAVRNDSLTGTGLSLSGTTLSGTPTSAQLGSHTIELRATNSEGNHDFSFTFVVGGIAPTGTVSPQGVNAGSAFSLDLLSSIGGNPAPTFTVRESSLDGTGLSLSGTTLSGTPTLAQAGVYTIEMTATNSVGNYDFTFTFTVRTAPEWTSIPNQTAFDDTAFSLDLSDYLSGIPDPTVAIRSLTTLPSWLTLSGTTISGTPTATAAGVTVQFTATNPAGSANVSFTLDVQEPLWTRTPPDIYASVSDQSTYRIGSGQVRSGVTRILYGVGFTPPTGMRITGSGANVTITYTPPTTYTNITTIPIRLRAIAGTAQQEISFDLTILPLAHYDRGTTTQVTPRSGTFGTTLYQYDVFFSNEVDRVWVINDSGRFYHFQAFNKSGHRQIPSDFNILIENIVGSSSTTRGIPGIAYRKWTPQGQTEAIEQVYILWSRSIGGVTNWLQKFDMSGNISSQGPTLLATSLRSREGIQNGLVFHGDHFYVYGRAPSGLRGSENRLLAFRADTGARDVQKDIRMTQGLRITHLISDGTYIFGMGVDTQRVHVFHPDRGEMPSSGWILRGAVSPGRFPQAHPRGFAYFDDKSILVGYYGRYEGRFGSHLTETRTVPARFDFMESYGDPHLDAWASIPAQSAEVTQPFSLDLSEHISAFPAATFAFQSDYTPPVWLSLTGSILSGTPPAGLYTSDQSLTVDVSATNSSGTQETSFTLTVDSGIAPVISRVSSSLLTASVGTEWSLDLTSHISGFPAPTLGLTGIYRLPSWLSLSGYVLSGTPPATSYTQGGTVTEIIELTLTNAKASTNIRLSLSIDAGAVPSWVTLVQYHAIVNTEWSLDLDPFLTDFPPATLAFKPGTAVPSWLSITGTVISGTPPAADYTSDTTLNLEIRATNAVGTADVNLRLNIQSNAAPFWTDDDINLVAYRAQAFDYTFGTEVLNGYPEPTVSISSNRPPWMSVSGRVISGTPTIAGTYSMQIVAVNRAGSASKRVNLVVNVGSAPLSVSATHTGRVVLTGSNEVRALRTTIGITGDPAPTMSFTAGQLVPSFVSLVEPDGLDIELPAIYNRAVAVPLTFTNFYGSVHVVVTFPLTSAPVWDAVIFPIPILSSRQTVTPSTVEVHLNALYEAEPAGTVTLSPDAEQLGLPTSTRPTAENRTVSLRSEERSGVTHQYLQIQAQDLTVGEAAWVKLVATNSAGSSTIQLPLIVVDYADPFDLDRLPVIPWFDYPRGSGLPFSYDIAGALWDALPVSPTDAQVVNFNPTTKVSGAISQMRISSEWRIIGSRTAPTKFFISVPGGIRSGDVSFVDSRAPSGRRLAADAGISGRYLYEIEIGSVTSVSPQITETKAETRPGAYLNYDLFEEPGIGVPRPTQIVSRPGFMLPDWLEIVENRYLRGVPPPEDFPRVTKVAINLRATNPLGERDFVVDLTVQTPTEPRFREIPSVINLTPPGVGDTRPNIFSGGVDLIDFLDPGFPYPQVLMKVTREQIYFNEDAATRVLTERLERSDLSFSKIQKKLDHAVYARLVDYYLGAVFRDQEVDWSLPEEERELIIEWNALAGANPRRYNKFLVQLVMINEVGVDTASFYLYLGGTGRPAFKPIDEVPVLSDTRFEVNLISLTVASRATLARTPEIQIRPGYVLPDWMSLSKQGFILSGTPPSRLFVTNALVEVPIVAQNTAGSANAIVPIRVLRGDPHWSPIPDQVVANGGLNWAFDLSEYILGDPTPTLSFAPGFEKPAWLTLEGTTLQGQPLGYERETTLTIGIQASNSKGNERQTFSLTVRPSFVFTKMRWLPARSDEQTLDNFERNELIWRPEALFTTPVPPQIRQYDNVRRESPLAGTTASADRIYLLGRETPGSPFKLLSFTHDGVLMNDESFAAPYAVAIVKTATRFYLFTPAPYANGNPGTIHAYTLEGNRVDSESWKFPTVEEQPGEFIPSGLREPPWTLFEVSSWFADMEYFNGALYFAAAHRDLGRELYAFDLTGQRLPDRDILLTSRIDEIGFMASTEDHIYLYALEDDIVYAFTRGGVYDPEYDLDIRAWLSEQADTPFGSGFYGARNRVATPEVVEMASTGEQLVFFTNTSQMLFFGNKPTPPRFYSYPAMVNNYLHTGGGFGKARPGYSELTLFMDGFPRPMIEIDTGAPDWFFILLGRYLYSRLPTSLYVVDEPTIFSVPIIMRNSTTTGGVVSENVVRDTIKFYVYPQSYSVEYSLRTDVKLPNFGIRYTRRSFFYRGRPSGPIKYWRGEPTPPDELFEGYGAFVLTPYVVNNAHFGAAGWPMWRFIAFSSGGLSAARAPRYMYARLYRYGSDLFMAFNRVYGGTYHRIIGVNRPHPRDRFTVRLGDPPITRTVDWRGIVTRTFTGNQDVDSIWLTIIPTQSVHVGQEFILNLQEWMTEGFPTPLPEIVPGTRVPPWLKLTGFLLHGTPGDDFAPDSYPVEHRVHLRISGTDTIVFIRVTKSAGFPKINEIPRLTTVVGENFSFDFAPYVPILPLATIKITGGYDALNTVVGASTLGGRVSIPQRGVLDVLNPFRTDERFETVLITVEATNIYGTDKRDVLLDVVGNAWTNPPRWWTEFPIPEVYQGQEIDFTLLDWIGGAPTPRLAWTPGQPRIAWLRIESGQLRGQCPADYEPGFHNFYVTGHGGTTGQETQGSAWTLRVKRVDALNGASWANIPRQTVIPGQPYRLLLTPYLRGAPSPSVTPKPGTELPSWVTLAGNVVSGIYDYNDFVSNPEFLLELRADNGLGYADVAIPIRVGYAPYPPIWARTPNMEVDYPDTLLTRNMQEFVRGHPTPRIALLPTSELPTWLSWDENTGILSTVPAVARAMFPQRYDNFLPPYDRFGDAPDYAPWNVTARLTFFATNAAITDGRNPQSSFTIRMRDHHTIAPGYRLPERQQLEAGVPWSIDIRALTYARPSLNEYGIGRRGVLPLGIALEDSVISWTPNPAFYLEARVERLAVSAWRVITDDDRERAGAHANLVWAVEGYIDLLVRPAQSDYPPAWGIFGIPVATVDQLFELDLSDYLTGLPAPLVDVPVDTMHELPFWLELDLTSDPGHPTLIGTPPGGYYDKPRYETVELRATNSEGSSYVTFTISVAQVILDNEDVPVYRTGEAPTWSNIPITPVEVGQQFNLDLRSFYAGDAPTLDFAEGYVKPSWLDLVDSHLQGVPPFNLFRTNSLFYISIGARNEWGYSTVTITLQLLVIDYPYLKQVGLTGLTGLPNNGCFCATQTRMYVALEGQMQVFTLTGERLADSGEEFNIPHVPIYGLIFRSGRFYLLTQEATVSRSGRVIVYTEGGVEITDAGFDIPLGHPRPLGIIYNVVEQVFWIGSETSQQVSAYNFDGTPNAPLNKQLGMGNDTPRDMLQAGTRIYVLDGGSKHLYSYDVTFDANINNDLWLQRETNSPRAVGFNGLQLLVLDGSTVWVYGQEIPDTGALPSIRGLPFLKKINFALPDGYSIGEGGMTSTEDRLYFAAADDDGGASRMLVYDQFGRRVIEEEFFLPRFPVFPLVFGLVKRGNIFYVLTREQGQTGSLNDSQFTGRVHSFSDTGLQGAGFEIDINEESPGRWHGSPVGLGFVNNGWWILGYEGRTDAEGVTAAWRYERDGSLRPLSKVTLANANRHLAGAAVTDRRILVLDYFDRQIYTYSYGMNQFVGDSTSLVVQNTSPKALGWNGYAAIVYDEDGGLYFYGHEAPTLRALPVPQEEEDADNPVFLYRLPLDIPDGYVVSRGGMTSDEDRIYIAATKFGVSSRLFVFDVETGARQMDEEFDIPLFPGFPSIFGITRQDDNFYFVTHEQGFTTAQSVTRNPDRTTPSASYRFFTGRVRVFSRTGVEGVGWTIWSFSSTSEDRPDPERGQGQSGQRNPTGITFYDRSWWIGGTRIVGQNEISNASVFKFSLRGNAQPDETAQLDDVVRNLVGIAQTDAEVYVLDDAELLLHRYTHQFSFLGHRHDIELHSANLFPLGVGWGNDRLVVYDRSGEAFFYGRLLSAIAPRPDPDTGDIPPGPIIGTGVSRRAEIARQQFRGMEEWAVSYDVVHLIGQNTLLVRALNVPCIVQTTAERLDLTTAVTVTEQLDTLTVYPKWVVADVEIGDLIAPASGAATPAEVTDVARVGRLEVIGVYTIGDDQYQEIYAREVDIS